MIVFFLFRKVQSCSFIDTDILCPEHVVCNNLVFLSYLFFIWKSRLTSIKIGIFISTRFQRDKQLHYGFAQEYKRN